MTAAVPIASARLESIAVRDFRNLARADLDVPVEGLVVIGENGQGKTNLLEAVYYLELFRSIRGARDQDLVRFGAPGFHIAAAIETDGAHEISVGFDRAGRRKRVRLDGGEPERLSDAIGALPAVMFAPGDVELVAGAPSARRRYLDIMLALSSRRYLAALQRYRTALGHRNAALRDAARTGRHDERVAIWEAPLAEHGAVLWAARLAWIERMAERFAELCNAIGEAAGVTIRYASVVQPGANLAVLLTGALADRRGVDIRRGLTHAGPHRDDLTLSIGGRDLRTFGSAGQHRTAAIALRMVEAETLSERRGGRPLMLLDDPFAELDARRAGRIVDLLAREGLGQTLLAVPRESDIPAGLPSLERRRIHAGEITMWSA
ncbi:MAG: DNA replication and repair protein RecF [Gemmatimonadota bacterium]|nr:DNA replication and repair protein RecF [Gemmatimonadota bacterium]